MHYYFCLFSSLLLLVVSAFNPEVDEAFDRSDEEDSYQREYVINVANKVEDCYYIPMRMNQVLNFHYVVSI